ncbi:MAG: VanW family protein [Bacillus sp. (in: firmicutes)]
MNLNVVRYFSLIFLGFFAILVGCTEKTVTKEKVQQQSESNEIETKKKIEEKPAVIKVIDPNTKQVIKSFIPKEMGFGTEDDTYRKELKQWIKDLARGTETADGYDKRMILNKLDANGQVIEGSPMVILDESELMEKIMDASEKGGEIELPLYVTASGFKVEDTAYISEAVVASYTTYFNPSDSGRNKNIELSANAIHNVILGNGDYFSFNSTVGKRTEANGYQPAPEAVKGKLVMGIGGGVCQTSSTLFNAVDQLGVSYVERHHHSVTVGYVPAGRDATVSDGGLDFRFQNTTGVPLILKAIISNGALTVELRTSNGYANMLKKSV